MYINYTNAYTHTACIIHISLYAHAQYLSMSVVLLLLSFPNCFVAVSLSLSVYTYIFIISTKRSFK